MTGEWWKIVDIFGAKDKFFSMTFPPAGDRIGAIGRVKNPGTSNISGYNLELRRVDNGQQVVLNRIDDEVFTQIFQGQTDGIDEIGLEIANSFITVYEKIGENWVMLGRRTDFAYNGAGSCGLKVIE